MDIHVWANLDGMTVIVASLALLLLLAVLRMPTSARTIEPVPHEHLSAFPLTLDPLPQVVATIPLVPYYPRYVAFAPDGQYAYVSHQSGPYVSVIYVADHTVSETIRIEGVIPRDFYLSGLDVTPDGQTLYVALRTTNQVVPIRLADRVQLPAIPVGAQPCALAILPDGSRAYVAGADGIDVIDLATHTVVAHLGGLGFLLSVAASPDGSHVGLSNDSYWGNVQIIDTATNRVSRSIPVVGAPHHDIAFSPDGEWIWTTGSQNGTAKAIRLADGKVLDIQLVYTQGPSGVAITPDGAWVYVSAYESNRVYIIRAADRQVVYSLPVGAWPDGVIAFSPDGRYLYVPNGHDNSVSVIDTRPALADEPRPTPKRSDQSKVVLR